MCGIAGGWFPEQVGPSVLEEALNTLRHRGPDDRGEYRDGTVQLGMRRLAIIDLVGGRQPLGNEDGSVTVVFNGEIYNYRELIPSLRAHGHLLRTDCDTEVLVHLFEEEGTAMCRLLRGMFAFALWDSRRRCLYLARDRFGKKPLYYARSPAGGLLFASELKALRVLVTAVGAPWAVRDQAIYHYLSLGVVPQPHTAFEDVQALPPASWLQFDGRNVTIRPYWHLDYAAKTSLPYRDAVERTRQLVSESVRLRLRSDVPLGVFLSGGVDSTAVAYEASRHLGNGLRTFTVAVEDPVFDESSVARRTAEALGVQSTVLPLRVAPADELSRLVRHYDQPFADSSAIPSLAVSRLARQHVTVVLNGDGGDEVFAGYRRDLAARLSPWATWLPGPFCGGAARALGLLARQRRSTPGFAARFVRGLSLDPAARYLAWTGDMLLESDKRRIWKGNPMRPTEDWVRAMLSKGLSPLDTQLRADVQINLLSDLLVKMDVATMAASIEGRSPLLDHTIAEFTAGLPDSYKCGGWRLKPLLRDAYRGRIPAEVLAGRKRGFEVPLRSWLEHEMRDVLMDTLADPSARVRGYLCGRFLDALLLGKVFRERNWAGTVYMLLVLELWLRELASFRP